MSQNSLKNSLRNGPNEKGYYGEFGSRYAPEILMPSLIELEKAFNSAINNKKFIEENLDNTFSVIYTDFWDIKNNNCSSKECKTY